MIPDELKGWDEINKIAESPIRASAAIANVKTGHKVTLALANLGAAVSSHQKVTGQRLQELTQSITVYTMESSRLGRSANRLAGAIAFFTLVQVVLAIFKR